MSLLLPQNPHASFQVRVASVTGCVVSFVICEDADQAFRFTRVCALREKKKGFKYAFETSFRLTSRIKFQNNFYI